MGNYWSTTQKPKYTWKKPKNPHKNKLKLLAVNPNLPVFFDLRSKMPPIYDQMSLGSCVDNSIAAAFQLVLNNSKMEDKSARSRLFMYFNARIMENEIYEDCGSSIEDCLSGIEKKGACSETLYPYYPQYFANLPPAQCYAAGKPYSGIATHQVDQDLNQIKQAIVNGFPVIFGIMVYSSFESPAVMKSGIIPLPKEGETELGGHCILACTYSDKDQCFIIRNSWGPDVGQKGYFFLPYSYVMNERLSADFWVITGLTC